MIIQGDAMDVLRTIDALSIDAIITDPPYGMSYQSAWRTDKTRWKPKLMNDTAPFIWWLYDAYRILKPHSPLLCFCDWKSQDIWKMAITAAGFTVRSQVIWDREWHGMGDLSGTFGPQHDIIWFASKGAYKFPGRRPRSVIRSQRTPADALEHPTEKPVDLLMHLIDATTRPGDVILDPFAGSGSTLEATILSGRHAQGIEIDAQYLPVIERRIQWALAQQQTPALYSKRPKPSNITLWEAES